MVEHLGPGLRVASISTFVHSCFNVSLDCLGVKAGRLFIPRISDLDILFLSMLLSRLILKNSPPSSALCKLLHCASSLYNFNFAFSLFGSWLCYFSNLKNL